MPKRKVVGVSPLIGNQDKGKPPLLGGIQLTAEVNIHQPPEICYRYWRDFSNLPTIMKHVQAVEVLDDYRSHWIVDGPGDTTVEWDAEILEDIPDERISWRSRENAQLDNAGSVQFAPLGTHETRLKVAMTYNPPLGALGDWIGRLFGETPDDVLADDLRRFKDTVEKGNS